MFIVTKSSFLISIFPWSNIFKNYFSNINVKVLIENCKKAVGSTNPAVRQTAITLLGTMYLYMGATLNVFFENEKPSLRDQINAECDKYEGEKPPPATRGKKIFYFSCSCYIYAMFEKYLVLFFYSVVILIHLLPLLDMLCGLLLQRW